MNFDDLRKLIHDKSFEAMMLKAKSDGLFAEIANLNKELQKICPHVTLTDYVYDDYRKMSGCKKCTECGKLIYDSNYIGIR